MTTIQDFFDETIKLPSPPAIALTILNAIRADENSFEEIAEVVAADPALTARILKIANSSLYGLPKQVDSLAQATSLLGTQTLKNIALSFVIVGDFQDNPQASFNLNLFWRRAITTAVAAELLAEATGYKNDDLFVSALLQDIGILIMFLSDATSYTEMLDNKRINGMNTCQAEKERFGFDHTEVGFHLLATWDLPGTICGPIRYHHSGEAGTPYQEAARILGFAGTISSVYHGNQSNRKSIQVRSGLADHYQCKDEQVDGLIDAVGEKALEILSVFDIPPGEMKPFSQIIQEANDELRRLNFSYEQIVLELKQAKQSAEQLAFNLKEANDKLRELAFRDDLTGLYNHRFFQEILEKEIHRSSRYQHPLSLLLLDIDYFKTINDTYGHPTGDRVLKEISLKMIELVRQNDIVARYGGEEFAIILPETGQVGGKVLAQRLRRGIEQLRIPHDNQDIALTVSIGLAGIESTDSMVSRAELIARSDQALYEAKRNGRNRVQVQERDPQTAPA